MENRTKFNLSNRIIEWKGNLEADSNITVENCEELESHLLDEIDSLKSFGLNEEESFIIATKRLGGFNELISEFGKVNQKEIFQSKLIEYLKGALIFLTLLIFLDIIVNMSVLIASYFVENNSLTQPVAIVSRIAILMVLGIVGFKIYNSNFGRLNVFTRLSFLIVMVIMSKFLLFFSNIMLARFLNPREFGMMSYNLTILNWSLTALVFVLTITLYFWNKKKNKPVFSK